MCKSTANAATILLVLSIVLTAADWVGPAGTAVADILHMADRP